MKLIKINFDGIFFALHVKLMGTFPALNSCSFKGNFLLASRRLLMYVEISGNRVFIKYYKVIELGSQTQIGWRATF